VIVAQLRDMVGVILECGVLVGSLIESDRETVVPVTDE